MVLDTVSWKAAVSGTWNNPANWDVNRVPGNADIAVIAATGANYTVTLDVNATVAGFTLNAANATFSSSDRTFTTNGPATLSAGTVVFGNSTWAGTGPLTNSATFTIERTANGVTSTISSPFLNQGTFAATDSTVVAINGPLTTADGALLRTQDAALTVANGFTNNGIIELQTTQGLLLGGGTLTVTSGTLTNAAGKTISALAGPGVRSITARLDNQGTLLVAGELTVVGLGTFSNTGTISVTGSELDLAFAQTQGGILENSGTINVTGGDLRSFGSVNNTGTITIVSGRTFTMAGSTFTHAAGTLSNDGSFDLSPRANFALAGGAVTGSGTFNIRNIADIGGLRPATLTGSGTLSGTVVNSGVIIPRSSPSMLSAGIVNITGNYTQTSTGTSSFVIGGPTPGTGFSQLNVTGSATLDGTLEATLINEFSPSPGSTFTILTRGSGSGTFRNLPDNATLTVSGQPFRINYTPTAVVLTRTGAALTATTTSVSSSANPSVIGQAVSFTATVSAGGSGSPTGTVTFTIDGTAQTPVPLSGSRATFSTSTLMVGPHTVTAAYSGDGNFSASSSVPLTQTVNPAVSQVATATVLQSSANPSVVGQPVIFTATVTSGAGTPTGTATFRDGTATLGTAILSGGRATFSTSALAVGSHPITAVYGGDSTFRGSTSPALTQVVNPVQPAGECNSQTFVAQLYRDLLQREADPAGFAAWTDFLDRGRQRSEVRVEVTMAFTASLEYRRLVTQGLYRRLLHREAEPSGLNALTNFLAAGGTVEQAQAAIIGSPEYFHNRGGGTNDGFLAAVYQDTLGRTLDPSGRTTFGRALAAGARRGEVSAAIFGSEEYRTDLVQGIYQQFLRRPADGNGLPTWVGALRKGARDETVIACILGSEEYCARV